ncbi:hypothetical protein BSKO_11281 [Bryopsis sp. KO-2023]|nr:hypothetical protein BSKO_11281 [Bryopsis sp. KO-2023]
MLRRCAIRLSNNAFFASESAVATVTRPVAASAAGNRVFGSMPERVADAESAASNERGWGRTKIADVLDMKAVGMKGDWLFCSKDDKVLDAVKKMARANCGSLLVFDPSKIVLKEKMPTSSDAVMGLITERDYLTKIVVEGKSSATTTVTEVMTPQSKLITVGPNDSVVKAMEVMADHNVRHVPVVNGNAMMGMVSIRDLVKVMVREHREEMEDVNSYIQGTY